MQSVSAVPEDISELIADNKVIVFSKTYCPYCKNTKQILTEFGIPFEVLELDVNELSAKQQEDLNNLSGIKTVPKIFIGKTSVGGNDALKKLVADNKLLKLLQDNKIEVSEDS